jgi:DNA-binding IclR family transcriptional regulator
MGSPSAERTLRILEFLTTHPGRGFTLSELSRRLKISKGTTYAILTTLTERGALVRPSDSHEYRLGPALIPIGSVAERGFPALTHAKREAERLAEELDIECVVVMAAGAELLIAGRAGTPGPRSITSREGQRRPLAPPLGAGLVAWMGDAAIDAWLDRLDGELTMAEREHYRDAIAVIRRQGYAVGIRGQRLIDLAQTYLAAELHTPEGRREILRAMAAVAHDDGYLPATEEGPPPDAELNSVAAPVFGPDGVLLFAISLMPTRHRARDAPPLARAVTRAAARVMAPIDGVQPPANALAALGPQNEQG